MSFGFRSCEFRLGRVSFGFRSCEFWSCEFGIHTAKTKFTRLKTEIHTTFIFENALKGFGSLVVGGHVSFVSEVVRVSCRRSCEFRALKGRVSFVLPEVV